MVNSTYKSVISALSMCLFIAGCTTTVTTTVPVQKVQTTEIPKGQRIYIPQEKVVIQQLTYQKSAPQAYIDWLSQADHQQQAHNYEKFLAQHDVANIVPPFELFRTARDWQKCGGTEYMIPNSELWGNQVATLKVFKYLVATKVLTDFEVTSVYRDLPMNQCAGGAGSSRHLYNSAIDFRIGPPIPQAEDYSNIENTKFKLCQFWAQYGQSLNMGLGLYASGQIHIDTQGYRTWGPSHGHESSMCNF